MSSLKPQLNNFIIVATIFKLLWTYNFLISGPVRIFKMHGGVVFTVGGGDLDIE